MLVEEPADLALAKAQALGQALHVTPVQGSGLNELQSAIDGVGGAAPGPHARSGLGTAAQTGPVTRSLGSSSGRIEFEIMGQRCAGRADGSAVDTRRLDPAEETPVKARVTGLDSSETGIRSQIIRSRIQ